MTSEKLPADINADGIIDDEEKVVKLRKETAELKKKVEKRQAILMVLEGDKDIR